MIYCFMCIVCFFGCFIEVDVENGKVKEVKGCKCFRGMEWVIQEVISLKRVVMSVVLVEGGVFLMVSVKIVEFVLKEKILELMKFLVKFKFKVLVSVG